MQFAFMQPRTWTPRFFVFALRSRCSLPGTFGRDTEAKEGKTPVVDIAAGQVKEAVGARFNSDASPLLRRCAFVTAR
jgi:hypothetical protein